MKLNKLSFLHVSTFIIFALLLSSCSMVKNSDFTSQKYTHFKRGETKVVAKKIMKDDLATEQYVSSQVKESFDPFVVSSDPTSTETKTVVNAHREYKVNKVTTSNNSEVSVKEPKKPLLKSALSFMMDRLVEKPNTTAVDGGDVNIIILVILSFIIPPLAVYLVKDIGNEFWISILLWIFFIVPGVVYALLISLGII